ncbi:MAG: hypothetical protein AAGA85_05940 [Bacteroidota bacterium]
MNSKDLYYNRWLMMAPLGLTLVGFGLCLTIDAGFTRYSGASWTVWVPYGVLGLAVFNAGVSIVGGAIINRCRYLVLSAAPLGSEKKPEENSGL